MVGRKGRKVINMITPGELSRYVASLTPDAASTMFYNLLCNTIVECGIENMNDLRSHLRKDCVDSAKELRSQAEDGPQN
jgi:hypothetical protein